ncbi:MAG: glycosyltransferase family 2 protein [Robiginitomaculum sp.]|nr:glycosyltransferase family 2 protein [Robiginitomaculum sp.]
MENEAKPDLLRLAENWSIPSFTETIFFPPRKPYFVVIPVINEGERIQNQLRKMHNAGVSKLADIILIDGGSTDGSLETSFLQKVGVCALLTKTGEGKLSAQLRCAYAWALQHQAQGIVTIDGNDKDGVGQIATFISKLSTGSGYLQSSRFIKGGEAKNTPLLRLLAIRLFHAPLQSLAAWVWLTDTTQGFRGYSSAFLLDPGTQPFRDIFKKYELLAYLTVRASQLGYQVEEIPTSRIYPKHEKTPTKITGIMPLVDLALIVVKVLFRVYHPKKLPRLQDKTDLKP